MVKDKSAKQIIPFNYFGVNISTLQKKRKLEVSQQAKEEKWTNLYEVETRADDAKATSILRRNKNRWHRITENTLGTGIEILTKANVKYKTLEWRNWNEHISRMGMNGILMMAGNSRHFHDVQLADP